MSKVILSDERVEECELADDSDYKWDVLLKKGFVWGCGRMAGCRPHFFNTVSDFKEMKRHIMKLSDYIDYCESNGIYVQYYEHE